MEHQEHMVIDNRDALRSLLAEAQRQADFFTKRRNVAVAAVWKLLAQHAFAALQETEAIALLLVHSTNKDSINKACEYCEQLPKANNASVL